MRWRSGGELRELFLSFFEGKGHRRYPSFSLIPDDPSILFTIAGMVPFKPYFLGEKVPEVSRATTCQKCVRTNDIENVGYTARHHTFFEMLGNFSFGDYFKREAASWAWEFLVDVVGFEPDRLWITIYKDDDEAFQIWNEVVGVPKERIVRLGEDSNFWKVGPVGPCGPCSELIYDQGPEFSCGKPDCAVGCDCDRYLEVWNLVFMQFNRKEDGSLEPLPKKNIDTGMGLERLTSVVQKVGSDFDTDLFKPIVDHVCSLAGVRYGYDRAQDVAVRVISDHIRSVCFMISDGIFPSNEGRGYVLRRILRRAVRFGKTLGIEEDFLAQLVPTVISTMGGAYPELVKHRAVTEQIVSIEESKFRRTMDQGASILAEEIRSVKVNGSDLLSGEVAFMLYDTFGFPLELTEEICRESGLKVDRRGFDLAMERQRERARAAASAKGFGKDLYVRLLEAHGETSFVGYDLLSTRGKVLALVKGGSPAESIAEGEEGEVLLDVTPFYAERGGQVGDRGELIWSSGRAEVLDTAMPLEGLHLHRVKVEKGVLSVGEAVEAKVSEEHRSPVRRHHTATHLLHRALEQVLGEHVRQAGSLVAPDHLRFDFTHFAPLSQEEIDKVEEIVNGKIVEDLPVLAIQTSRAEAERMGAKALFEEKYGDVVRVIKIGDFSAELCGGTHVRSTGEIGLFKVVKEEGVGSGLRRITAKCGMEALREFQRLSRTVDQVCELMSVDQGRVLDRVKQLLEDLKDRERELREAKRRWAFLVSEGFIAQRQIANGISVVSGVLREKVDEELLREVADHIRGKLFKAVVALASVFEGKVSMVIFADKEAVSSGVHAGRLASELAKMVGGGGGGRPDMGQAGGKMPERVEEALGALPVLIQGQVR